MIPTTNDQLDLRWHPEILAIKHAVNDVAALLQNIEARITHLESMQAPLGHHHQIPGHEVGRSQAQVIAEGLINAIERNIGATAPLAQVAKHSAPGQCAAVTRKSQRCNIPADADSEFCHVHRPDGAYQKNLRRKQYGVG